MIKKRCTKCGKAKLLKFFGLDERNGKSYVLSRCKSCVSADARAWNQRNPERAREAKRRWAQTEKGKACHRAGYKRWLEKEGNREKARESRRRWALTERGREVCQRARLKWLAAHPDAIDFRSVSLDAPVREGEQSGTLLDLIADDKAVSPLESLIQKEAVVEIAKRLVSEKGFSWKAAIAIVEAHA